MRDEPVAASLMKLGIPTMIGMLISALYNAIDAYFVSGLGMSQMGAVSVRSEERSCRERVSSPV